MAYSVNLPDQDAVQINAQQNIALETSMKKKRVQPLMTAMGRSLMAFLLMPAA